MLLFSCKDDIDTTFEDINITTEENTIVEVNIPKALGNTSISNAINSAINKEVIADLHIGEPESIRTTTIKESITTFNKEFDNFQTDFPETTQVWEAQIDGEIMFTSPDIISIALTSYTNTGGAHGMLKISFLNFEASTGKTISNENLINDIEAFKQIASPYFKEATKDKDIFESELDIFNLPENMGYNDEGIVLLYNAYEIAPYSTGIIEFEIPFNEIESYLTFNGAR
ncbi:DUF3298 and DUF4163 domain-containing protein [Algibacter sp. L4_22]|uniref:DUF3298 and DUF4163 domain-containing protein n=1 Tax=Algibacter sp. L4_22 TaxID=2942477 RepID=UPI00201B95FE|nr:DUF3298 and DUF4163 domain-containing protein [Algibacter sp. L4_22]MCL5127371.1 DUF3298 and DUF4163 domain-containing protein [Algibacter sp. L4_22]